MVRICSCMDAAKINKKCLAKHMPYHITKYILPIMINIWADLCSRNLLLLVVNYIRTVGSWAVWMVGTNKRVSSPQSDPEATISSQLPLWAFAKSRNGFPTDLVSVLSEIITFSRPYVTCPSWPISFPTLLSLDPRFSLCWSITCFQTDLDSCCSYCLSCPPTVHVMLACTCKMWNAISCLL